MLKKKNQQVSQHHPDNRHNVDNAVVVVAASKDRGKAHARDNNAVVRVAVARIQVVEIAPVVVIEKRVPVEIKALVQGNQLTKSKQRAQRASKLSQLKPQDPLLKRKPNQARIVVAAKVTAMCAVAVVADAGDAVMGKQTKIETKGLKIAAKIPRLIVNQAMKPSKVIKRLPISNQSQHPLTLAKHQTVKLTAQILVMNSQPPMNH